MATTITGQTGLTFRRGDTGTWTYQLLFEDDFGFPTGEYFDLTDVTIKMEARWDQDTTWFEFPTNIINAPLGMFEFYLTKEQSEQLIPVGSPPPDSSSYECQLSWIEDEGLPTERTEVVTILTGTLTVQRDLVR